MDQIALESLSDSYTRRQITIFAKENFAFKLEGLLLEIESATVRSKLRDNKTSFDNIMQLSDLRLSLLAPSVCAALLGGFLYMAIHQSVRQAERSQGRSDECYHRVIDMLRRCNEAGAILHSRCIDPKMPAKHVKERLGSAYSLLLALTGAIVESLDQSPLGKCWISARII